MLVCFIGLIVGSFKNQTACSKTNAAPFSKGRDKLLPNCNCHGQPEYLTNSLRARDRNDWLHLIRRSIKTTNRNVIWLIMLTNVILDTNYTVRHIEYSGSHTLRNPLSSCDLAYVYVTFLDKLYRAYQWACTSIMIST